MFNVKLNGVGWMFALIFAYAMIFDGMLMIEHLVPVMPMWKFVLMLGAMMIMSIAGAFTLGRFVQMTFNTPRLHLVKK